MKQKLLALCLFAFAFCLPAFAQNDDEGMEPAQQTDEAVYTEYGRVKKVHDGDSYVLDLMVDIPVRLVGVDCPEIYSGYVTATQPYGRAVGDSVRALLKGQKVVPESYGFDQYGRMLVKISLPDGRDLGQLLLERGWGWYVPQKRTAKSNTLPLRTRRAYKSAQDNAKKAKLGLWAGYTNPAGKRVAPVSPAQWRAIHQPKKPQT